MPTGTGSISITAAGVAKTENFDSLSNTAASSTNTALPAGWYISETGTSARANNQYAVDTGGSNTADIYSYGAAGSSDRALGGLRSGTLTPLFGGSFTNDTGTSINALDIAYTGEEWRLGTAGRADRLDFQISFNATSIDDPAATWLDVDALDFASPDTAGSTGARDGNGAADRSAIASSITGLNIPAGATFFIRWADFDASGADDGLAVDNFSITAHTAGPVLPALSIADVSQAEGASGATIFTFTVSLSAPAPAGGVSFDIATADGSAIAGSDYVAKALTGQVIPQGSSTYTFAVIVNGDTAVEPNESFLVNISNVTGATVADGQAAGTIVNDDVAGAFSIGDASVVEGNSGTSALTFTVSRDAASNVPASVHYDVLLPGGASGASASDFAAGTPLAGDLAFAAGETSKTITLQVAGDTVVENDESFTINLSAPTNGATLADAQGLGTIVNDDVAPVPIVAVADATIVEGQQGVSYLVFTVSLNIPAPSPVTLDFSTADGSAVAGSDYLAVSGSLSFAAGETSKTISVPVVGDTVLEPNETLSLTLSNVSGATVGDGSAVGNIVNDDAAGYFPLASGTFSENWTDTGRITANDDWSHVPYIIGWLGDIDSASPTGVDPRTLTGPNLGQIDVIANQTSTAITSGGVAEFQIANPTIALQGSGTADAPSLVLYMDARGRSDIHLTATLRDIDGTADNAAQAIAVQYRTDPSGSWTNVPAGYFADVTTGPSLASQTTALDVILPADANDAGTLEIRILTTNAIGNDEWVGIDDIVVTSAQGPASYSIADAAAFEGNGGTHPISFVVTRAGDSSAAGSVAWNVDFAGGGFSADAADFASPLSGVVSFAAGETSKTVTLQLVGDLAPEADEGFTVTLSSPSSGHIGDGVANGTIVNDDGAPPLVAISDVSQVEGDSGATLFTFTVTRTGGSNAFTVDYATANGSAAAGSDYLAASGTLAFAAGETSKTISVTVNGDTTGELNETFAVNLSNPTGFAVLADASGTGTIVNDDAIPIYMIQGAGHVSPFNGQALRTTGIVTAVDSNGFYIQDPTGDGNSATSDAVFVFTGSVAPTVAVGDAVSVAGTVAEFGPAGSLTTTEISGNPTVTILSHGNPLPAAVLIGEHGVLPPTSVMENDGFTSFDPANDGLDFYESLEGMRVTVETPIAVSNTNSFGETWVVASGGVGATGMSERGGITISPGDYNPERIQLDADSDIFAGYTPNHSQGDRLGNVTGIINYANSSYELLVTEAVTVIQDVTLGQETTALDGDRDHLTIADYNIENADPGDPQLKFDLLAHNIVYNLKTPDIIALQEVQDADGPGTGSDFSGYATAQKLIDAIVAAGGPVYSYIEVTPTGSTGGEPNGHIHPGFLYDPTRVSYIVGSAAIIEDPAYAGSRNPLIADFMFNGERVKLIDVHFTSRLGSDPLEGSNQPPSDAGDGSRTAQGQAVANYVATQLAADPSLKLGVLGDFNGFYFEGAVGAIEAKGLTDLLRTLPSEERYTYMFDGNAQAIDHIIVSPGLFTGAQFDAVHLNSEFSNNTDRPTDHDSVIARFSIPHPNQSPANLALDHAAVDENQPAGTLVGNLAATDPDGDALTYSLVDNAGGRFVVDPATGRITTTGALDYEAGHSYTLVARATDGGGLFVEKSFVVAVGDVNEAPTGLVLDHASVNENLPAGTLVGTLSATDPDGNPIAYSLVDNAGGRFAVDSATGRITTTTALDYETAHSYTVIARAADAGGLATQQSFAIAIGDVNEAPTAHADSVAVNEDATTPNLWSTLLANDSDPDAGTTLGISAVNTSGTQGHVLFDAAHQSLVYVADADAFDALLPGQTTTDSFTYTATDAGGLTSTATVTVTITGIADGITVSAGSGNDTVTGTSGEDRLDGGNGNDIVNGLDGHDRIWGGNGNDTLRGGTGNDYLSGDNGNDVLDGGSGKDLLAGGAGNDTLTGGAGADGFIFARGGGNDVITDFDTSVDTIFLDDGIAVRSWKVEDVNHDGVADLNIAFSSGGGSLVLLGVGSFAAVHFSDDVPPVPTFA